MVLRNNKLRSKLHTAVCLLGLASTAKAVTVQDLGTLGGDASFAYDINDFDHVVGLAQDSSKELETFIFRGNAMTGLPLTATTTQLGVNNSDQVAGGATGTDGLVHPAYYNSIIPTMHILSNLEGYATAINNANNVVGWYYLPSGDRHAFLFDGTTTRDISRGKVSYAFDINNSNTVVGSGINGPWRYIQNGTLTFLRPFGNVDGNARAINDNGDIVGEGNDNGTTRAFLWVNGTITAIGSNTAAFDVNNKQSVVGVVFLPPVCRTCQSTSHAFEWHSGVFTDLNTLTTNSGWELQVARAINNFGSIVGYGIKDGEVHGFLFNP